MPQYCRSLIDDGLCMTPATTACFDHAATGGALYCRHVDSGLRIGLPDALGRLWFDCDPRGFVITPAYDPMHRPVATGIALRGVCGAVVAARINYGEALPRDEAYAQNLRGAQFQSFSQDGWSMLRGATLQGAPLALVRRLTRNYAGRDDGMPAVPVPELGSNAVQDAELQAEGFSGSMQRWDAAGRLLEAVTLTGNRMCGAYALSGMPVSISADSTPCLSGFSFNARGQLLSVARGTADNGSQLFSTWRYDACSFLCGQRYASTLPAVAMAAGSGWLIGSSDAGRRQDARLFFDPSGNVAQLQDAFPEIVFGTDRTARSDYAYDALYRLLSASGLESRPGGQERESFDSTSLLPYSQRFTYDDSGNIVRMRHTGGSLHASMQMKISDGSNRSIPESLYEACGGQPCGTGISESFFSAEALFDACGSQLRSGGRSMSWNFQNQAIRTGHTADKGGATITEYSVHTADGSGRSRKVTETRNESGILQRLQLVTFLGDAERRRSYVQANDAGILFDGETVANAVVGSDYTELRILLGHAQLLRIQDGVMAAGGARIKRTWYSLTDHLDSCQTELASDGSIASLETFYPYGGTSVNFPDAGDNGPAVKVRKYSGEERDGSGLYHYGFRFYDASASRWMSPDPSGFAGSGLNWYRMVDGNPVSTRDALGLARNYRSTQGETIRVYDRTDFAALHASLQRGRVTNYFVLSRQGREGNASGTVDTLRLLGGIGSASLAVQTLDRRPMRTRAGQLLSPLLNAEDMSRLTAANARGDRDGERESQAIVLRHAKAFMACGRQGVFVMDDSRLRYNAAAGSVPQFIRMLFTFRDRGVHGRVVVPLWNALRGRDASTSLRKFTDFLKLRGMGFQVFENISPQDARERGSGFDDIPRWHYTRMFLVLGGLPPAAASSVERALVVAAAAPPRLSAPPVLPALPALLALPAPPVLLALPAPPPPSGHAPAGPAQRPASRRRGGLSSSLSPVYRQYTPLATPLTYRSTFLDELVEEKEEM